MFAPPYCSGSVMPSRPASPISVMMARSKVSWRKASRTRGASFALQNAWAESRTMRSSSLSSSFRSNGSAQSKDASFSGNGLDLDLTAPDMGSFREKFEYGLLIDFVPHRQHVIAMGHNHSPRIAKSCGQRLRRAGDPILAAADNQCGRFDRGKRLARQGMARAAHAGGKSLRVLSG